ncbi:MULTISPECIES: holin [Streptomyces]|uniref:Holin n=1 Tax=Streptomyces venezuelae TaxID=54571 RepID=A0A5P2B4A9_STRVZ|nr:MULTISPECIES: holin [Streptomyces]NEA01574.1 holin [Streptomyces sp. SID10116]MYY81603.1 holin [Streptomyces sp. SID335]MYZ14013.1 holin [Streptomyces sp. SID337]NDZ91232.1 holin [Streptomyces sp. SID10115]NEB44105.1 holin [Streptomyces sp. SID339]
MWNAAFWKATAERAIRTFAQALAAVLVAGATSLLDVAWGAAFATAGLAAVLAVLTAIGASEVGASGPGLTEEPTKRARAGETAG